MLGNLGYGDRVRGDTGGRPEASPGHVNLGKTIALAYELVRMLYAFSQSGRFVHRGEGKGEGKARILSLPPCWYIDCNRLYCTDCTDTGCTDTHCTVLIANRDVLLAGRMDWVIGILIANLDGLATRIQH